MNIEKKQVLYPGISFTYTYDFGSSTILELEVIEKYHPMFNEKGILLVGRNMPIGSEINSPRLGICGYDGPPIFHLEIMTIKLKIINFTLHLEFYSKNKKYFLKPLI